MDLGARLRALRTASGRTIASVAADAGLSVPYIANLENDRGNPTLAALERLAEALGVRLVIDLATPPSDAPDTVAEFAESARFRTEIAHLAKRTGVSERTARERVLALFAAAATAIDRPLSTLDCHRLLDGIVVSAHEG